MIRKMKRIPSHGRAAPDNAHHGHLRHSRGDEEIEAHRRRDHADFHVDHHDDAQMDGVDAELNGDREDQRRDDHDQARGFHELPADQKNEIYDHQEHDGPKTGIQHGTGDGLGNLLVRQDMLQDQRVWR